MLRIWFVEVLLAAEDAAQPGGDGPPGGNDPFAFFRGLLVPMALVFFIFWLLVFRPEGRKRKERERMIAAVKKGDSVVTTGGLLGKVWRVDGHEVWVIIDKDGEVKARFLKSAILEVVRVEASAQGDSSSQVGSQGDQ